MNDDRGTSSALGSSSEDRVISQEREHTKRPLYKIWGTHVRYPVESFRLKQSQNEQATEIQSDQEDRLGLREVLQERQTDPNPGSWVPGCHQGRPLGSTLCKNVKICLPIR